MKATWRNFKFLEKKKHFFLNLVVVCGFIGLVFIVKVVAVVF